jgi:hypothetical protein
LGTVEEVPIVNAAIAYDDPRTGETYILMINQALYFQDMDYILLCPMQLRLNDVIVNERPKFLTERPTDQDHAIICLPLIITLEIDGVTSYFPVRKPSQEEYRDCQRIELTYSDPEWKPNDTRYAEEEATLINHDGTLLPKDNHVFALEFLSNQDMMNRIVNSMFVTVPGRNVAASTVETFTISPELLARTWNISLQAAKRTLEATSQKGIRTVQFPNIERRWPTGDRPLRYKKLNHQVYHDTLKSSIISLRGNKCSEIYATDFGWSRNFPMKKESDVHETLDMFFHRYGVPEALISDGAKAYTGGRFKEKAKEAGCYCKLTDPYSPWQNRAEGEIREVKRLAGRWMVSTKSPRRLWDDCIELASLIRSNTAHDLYQLNNQVPDTLMFGQTADISHLCEFKWYSWVLFNDSRTHFPDDKVVLGRYLGPTDPEAGSVMTAKILKANGEVVRRNTYRHIRQEEFESEEYKLLRADFDKTVAQRLGDAMNEDDVKKRDISAFTPEYEPYEDDETPAIITPEQDDIDEESSAYDGYLTSQVMLPKGDNYQMGTVINRKINDAGLPIGTQNDNPILDTRVYEVQFADGDVLEYAANIIAENLYSQTDQEGKRYVLLDAIVDHKKDGSAISKDDEYVTVNGRKHKRKTTKGWKLCVQWKDGSTSWERLAALKESHPVEVAEYAVAQKISQEPAFAWWVPFTLKRRDRIVASVNKRYAARTHQFGIQLPKSVKEALEIDRRTGTTFWRDAIALEVKNVGVAFEDLDDDDPIPIGSQFIKCHWVFAIKVGTLKRKARLVAGGHMTEDPNTSTYASVVSRESVRIGLLIAALNGLDILSADIQNAYLTSPCQEKVYTILGPEFGAAREARDLSLYEHYTD